MKRKICIVMTVRGNYAKMKSILQQIKLRPDLDLQLVVGGAVILHKFGNPLNIIEEDGFAINETIHFLVEGGKPITMAKSTGLAVVELSTVFENLKPDIVIAIADRFEAMAVAVAASYMNIPVAHLEGGELSGSIDESIRHAITKLSHLHFVATKLSADRVIKMGEDPSTVFVVGSPTIDLIRANAMDLDFNVYEKYGGVGKVSSLSKGNYVVVIQHPVTTEYESATGQVLETLHAVSSMNMPTLWLWPNMDAGTDDISKGIRNFREQYNPQYIHFFKNFAFEDYARLLSNCAVLVGNTSSGIRESAFLGVPVVNIGTRQNYRERGANVIDVPYDREQIKQAIAQQIKHGRYPCDPLYGDGHAGEKIAEVLSTTRITVQKRLSY